MTRGCAQVAALMLLSTTLPAASAQGDERGAEDEAVLASRRLKLTAGASRAGITYPVRGGQRDVVGGWGWNLEAAAGLAHALEVGARVGLRDHDGRAQRADEIARGFDTETFGTGLGTVANPELRLRWRLIFRGALEAGVEDRVVLPWPGESMATEVLGAWAAMRPVHAVRIDVALNGVLTRYSFAAGATWAPAVSAPLLLRASGPRRLFVALFGTARLFAATSYSAARRELIAGAGAGGDIGACSTSALIEAKDLLAQGVLDGDTNRYGVALTLSCRF